MAAETASAVQSTSPATDAVRRAALLAALDVVQGGAEERFERITRIAREAFGVSGSFLNLAGDEHLTIKSQQGEKPFGPTIPLQDTFCGRSLASPGPVLVPDATADARFRDLPMVTGDPNIRFYAGVPLRLGDEHVKVGTLCLIDPAPRTLDDDDVALLQELGIWAERELAAGADEDRVRSVLAGLEPGAVEVPGYRVTGMSVPHGVVSGDFHDWHVSDRGLHVTLADVMGKGMSAGLLAANIRGALLAHGAAPAPGAIGAVEAQVAPELSRAESFATLFHGVLEPATGTVEFIDAGHGLVLQLHHDGTETIHRSLDLPLGLHPIGFARSTGSLELEPGDVLILVSDGALELWDSTLASLSRLGGLYRGSADVETFLGRIRARALSHDPGDDLTVVVVARDA
ncbi:PP2C family protein-serine/threonine phosphatase [Curtobacterium sp. VKM Ac-2922]|uniref:PP2C family protein-serine/threonine phosphatase n=1 Tax=Curtobacterium sp. VKM Ac-2922 TaxID=2929475 RepID=UPI001FB3B159|nr:GAF domain-containing SpoIIE family protein phosphatase [Curtobacterium sp. VKM Ac-2922]MCJ1714799.1 SpoIIE family protein phosphatase [Curtobacterium sp. VKM Ac-2922]